MIEAGRPPVDLALAASREADEATMFELAAQDSNELLAGHVGQPEIDDRDVDRPPVGDRERLLRRDRSLGLAADGLEQHSEQRAAVLVVVDEIGRASCRARVWVRRRG